ncbi:hypothetical protein FRC01_004767 [Tulasnella sp. 417]|nr:hypothetical protein FRC01_004767 [Tulasnella sp. 417]
MLLKYRPMFHGGSGGDAEKFIRVVCDKAIDERKQEDNKWIVTYASSCLAGEALRWFVYLDPDTQENWRKLQQALLHQYPRGGSAGPALDLVPAGPPAAPAPKPARRGRIRVSNSNSSTQQYLSKRLPPNNRVSITTSLVDALEVEWSTGSDGLQTLSIPGGMIYSGLGGMILPRSGSSPYYLASTQNPA